MIDLRSDSVPPSPAMRRAMSEAATGDELFREDPATRALEDYAAHLLGKQAALFVPTGTMGNALALLVHARSHHLMDRFAHIVRREMQWPSVLAEQDSGRSRSRLARLTVYDTADGCPNGEQLRSLRNGLVSLETTHTWRWGMALPLERMQATAQITRAAGDVVHLDGARLFNAAVALDIEPRTIAETTDSLVFSLCKALGAPAGAILAGEAAFIDTARDYRLALGGTMRQTGNIAAAGLFALKTGWDHLHIDHARARALANGVAEALAVHKIEGFRADRFMTNVVMLDTEPLEISGAEFVRRAAERDVKLALLGPQRIRITVHRDLTDSDVERAGQALREVIAGAEA